MTTNDLPAEDTGERVENYSGDGLETQAKPPRGTRFNPKVVIPILGGLAVVVAISWISGMAKQQAMMDERQSAQVIQEVVPPNANLEPAVIATLPGDYDTLIKQRRDEEARAELERRRREAEAQAMAGSGQPVLQNAVYQQPPEGFRAPPSQVQAAPSNAQKTAADQYREQQLRAMIQAENAARRAPIGFGVQTGPAPQNGMAAPTQPDPTTAAIETYAEVVRPRSDIELENGQSAKQAFLDNARMPNIYNPYVITDPITPNEVMAGSIIPATLITGMNSDLPGQLVAQVRENVFDTPTGRTLVIPQGTKIIGTYSSSVTYGQERGLVAWNRLIFPSGRSISLDNFSGVDLTGFAGFKDRVNNHYLRTFGSIVFGSAISAGADAIGDDDEIFLRDSSDGIDRAVEQLVRKNLNIQPTLEIRPGYRFNVFVYSDVVLPPYSAL